MLQLFKIFISFYFVTPLTVNHLHRQLTVCQLTHNTGMVPVSGHLHVYLHYLVHLLPALFSTTLTNDTRQARLLTTDVSQKQPVCTPVGYILHNSKIKTSKTLAPPAFTFA